MRSVSTYVHMYIWLLHVHANVQVCSMATLDTDQAESASDDNTDVDLRPPSSERKYQGSVMYSNKGVESKVSLCTTCQSCHPCHCKEAIPFSQSLRMHCNCLTDDDFKKRSSELKSHLLHHGLCPGPDRWSVSHQERRCSHPMDKNSLQQGGSTGRHVPPKPPHLYYPDKEQSSGATCLQPHENSHPQTAPDSLPTIKEPSVPLDQSRAQASRPPTSEWKQPLFYQMLPHLQPRPDGHQIPEHNHHPSLQHTYYSYLQDKERYLLDRMQDV